MRRLIAACVIVLAACGGGSSRVQGVVTDVDGDLTSISSFTVRTGDGPLTFVPDPEFTFDGGPAAHLYDHLRSSEPVEVRYRQEGGDLIAESAGDA